MIAAAALALAFAWAALGTVLAIRAWEYRSDAKATKREADEVLIAANRAWVAARHAGLAANKSGRGWRG